MWRCVQKLRRDAFVSQDAARRWQEGASKVVAKRFTAETLAAATCCPRGDAAEAPDLFLCDSVAEI